MKIVVLSDTHNHHKAIQVPEGDVLVHCGDFTGLGHHGEVRSFLKWFASLPHLYKIYIAGNHDLTYEREPGFKEEMIKQYQERITYLEDAEIVIDGIKFYGSPWQPEFNNWAFGCKRGGEKLWDAWQKIPNDTDVLITHTPPKNILDRCWFETKGYPQNAGCEHLRDRIEVIGNIKHHFFGHVHEAYGEEFLGKTICHNASNCNLMYDPLNPAIWVEI